MLCVVSMIHRPVTKLKLIDFCSLIYRAFLHNIGDRKELTDPHFALCESNTVLRSGGLDVHSVFAPLYGVRGLFQHELSRVLAHC